MVGMVMQVAHNILLYFFCGPAVYIPYTDLRKMANAITSIYFASTYVTRLHN